MGYMESLEMAGAKISSTYPAEFSTMICKMCGDERELTEDEKTEHKIGSKEDYFKKLYDQ